MKTKMIIFLVSFLLLSTLLKAQAIYFTTPSDNHVFSIPGNQSTTTVTIDFDYAVVVNPTYKLFADPSGNWSGHSYYDIQKNHTLPAGTYNWRLELYANVPGSGNVLMGTDYITFYVKNTVHAANNFSGGSINLEGAVVQSGSSVLKLPNESVSVGAIDQNDDQGYYRIWNTNGTNNSNWLKNFSAPIFGATSRNYSYTVASGDNGATLTADLKKVCNVTFQNNFVSVGNGGTINVNSSSYNSPTSNFQVIELNGITAYAPQQTINGINYTFTQWNDGNTSNPRTFTPGSTIQFTATYRGVPSSSPMGTTMNYGQSGQYVQLSWTEHPNSNVTQYRIYRGAKVENNFTNPVVIATVSRGTTSYTDYNYIVGGSSPNSVAYDVVPYYSTESTWGNVGMNIISATRDLSKTAGNELAETKTEELPKNYSISNYPNPFNPSTTISYQLPENGYVTIKVYDVLGKEIATLVNENKQAGYHNVSFDGKDLTSGIYIYSIQTNNYSESRKMLLVK